MYLPQRNHKGEYVSDRREMSRGDLLRIGSVVMCAAAGVFAGIDQYSRTQLTGSVASEMISGKSTRVLSSIAPGFLAKVDRQLSPVEGVMLRYGDVQYIQPYGDRFDIESASERAAEDIESELRRRNHDEHALIGVSLGGDVMAKAGKLLHEKGVYEEYSVNPHGIFIDTPAYRADLQLASRFGATIVAMLRPGALSNAIPHPPYIAETGDPKIDKSIMLSNEQSLSMFSDQLRAIVDAPKPEAGSLDFLDSLVFIRSTEDTLVNGKHALATWMNAAGPNVRRGSIDVAIPHAGIENNEDKSRRAFEAAYKFTLAA